MPQPFPGSCSCDLAKGCKALWWARLPFQHLSSLPEEEQGFTCFSSLPVIMICCQHRLLVLKKINNQRTVMALVVRKLAACAISDAMLREFPVSEFQEEGMNAINLPLSPISFELDPEDTMLEKLESEKLNVAEVTQSEIAQKQKLQTVLEKINETLKLPPRSIKWNVDSVHAKSLVAILHLLVALSQYFRAPIRLPDHVSIQVVVVQKREGILQSRQIQEEITERDAFDTLFDHAPDKLNVVKKTLITFVNKHLNKLNLEVTELETQFADGVYLVLLMGLLEGYFVPLHSFFLTPDSFEQKVLNVSFAFELMQDGGLEKPKPRPEDIVNCDLKSTLRVLYNLFTKYRNVE
ncbi:Alpha-parvin [Microtus ochrogaster]|uniref:Alpha-parvin n=1 Tax=Microtus ochrogaster TaxID=79684 RepID=A0A8J6KM91_MICOH|nr:Alpha-parvin [Microtus ochrogaster]